MKTQKKDRYQQVIEANIAVHTKLSSHYSSCEPHFRPENQERVSAKLESLTKSVKAKKVLDLGCGTGFVINLVKKFVSEVHGVDVTQAMLDKVDTSGKAKIKLIRHDTGTVPVEAGGYDLVTAYSFLHHLYDVEPTMKTAFRALRPGGKFYIDLEPNADFWDGVNQLERKGDYDGILKREIEQVTYKDEDIEKNFGVPAKVFNDAEYGKSFAGGFKGPEMEKMLRKIGFKEVTLSYNWFVGQGSLINDESLPKAERFRHAEVMEAMLQKAIPLSRGLFKYLGLVAVK